MLTMTVESEEIKTDSQHYDSDNDSRDDVNYIRHYLIIHTNLLGEKKYERIKYHNALEFS